MELPSIENGTIASRKDMVRDVQEVSLESLRYFIRYQSQDSEEAVGNGKLDFRIEDRITDNECKCC